MSSNKVFGQGSEAQAFAFAENDGKEQLRHWNASPLSFLSYLNIYEDCSFCCQAHLQNVSLVPRVILGWYTSFRTPSFCRTAALEITPDNYYCSDTVWQRSLDYHPSMALSLQIPLKCDVWSQESGALHRIICEGRYSEPPLPFFSDVKSKHRVYSTVLQHLLSS